MAQITVTQAAKDHVRDVLVFHPYQKPVLTIYRDREQKDVIRGANGVVHWRSEGSTSWKASLIDWADMPEGISIHPVSSDGMLVAWTTEAAAEGGTLVVDCNAEGLYVTGSAI
jgi:hypothetical protein